MIYTLGCSFTKWVWPTWSDWLSEYTREPITNLAWPGLSNEVIYWELMARRKSILSTDNVIIMFTGNNRLSEWYDAEFINQYKLYDHFPRKDGKFELSDVPGIGMYRALQDNKYSLTNMIINNFKIIYNIQQLLNEIGCRYTFLVWQNPWHDVRPKVKPFWEALWPAKTLSFSAEETELISTISKIPAVSSLLSSINSSKFIPSMQISTPETCVGLWEYRLTKLKDPAYFQYTHKDPHPDTLTHHDFAVEHILKKPLADSLIREKAKELAILCNKYDVNFPYTSLIANSLDDKIKKLYE